MTDNRSTAHAREGQQHTPGPWTFSPDDPSQVNIYGDTGRIVAVVDNVDEHDEANARLITAAPDLLQAARYALELISTARNYFPKSIQNRDKFQLENINAAIGTAIAKAEGL